MLNSSHHPFDLKTPWSVICCLKVWLLFCKNTICVIWLQLLFRQAMEYCPKLANGSTRMCLLETFHPPQQRLLQERISKTHLQPWSIPLTRPSKVRIIFVLQSMAQLYAKITHILSNYPLILFYNSNWRYKQVMSCTSTQHIYWNHNTRKLPLRLSLINVSG